MFKLLSKESNIFSIPVYIFFLLFIVIAFNYLSFSGLQVISAIITFIGVALGYFCIHAIGLNNSSHLPLFVYTLFIFSFYTGDLDIGLAVTLLVNSLLILILTSYTEEIRKIPYVLVGVLMGINFMFLPTTWPIQIFVLLHTISTSHRIGLSIFRLFFGGLLISICYASVMYFWDFTSFDDLYFPFGHFEPVTDFSQLIPLTPIILMTIYAIFDHFVHYNQKSPQSRFKYTFLLLFTLALTTTVVLYMGYTYEYLILLSLPLSIILSRMLRYISKPWIREVGLWTIVVCLLAFKAKVYFNI